MKKKVKTQGKQKTVLTPRFTKSHQKPKGKVKVTAVASKDEFYRVDLEVASKGKDGTTQYTYSSEQASAKGVLEEAARKIVEELKLMGVGGRLVHLDGTPEGTPILMWGSVERTAAAEKVERASLEKTTGQP